MAELSFDQKQFVREVKALCLKNYENGGDTIIECFEDCEIVAEFKTLADVKEYCGLKVEQELNCRWGNDDDPEVRRAAKFANWEE